MSERRSASVDSPGDTLCAALSSHPLARSAWPLIQNSALSHRGGYEVVGHGFPFTHLVRGPDNNVPCREGATGRTLGPGRTLVARKLRVLNHQEIDVAVLAVVIARA